MNKKKAFKIAAASAVAASAFVAAAPGNSFAASKAVVKSVSAINPITVTVGGKVSLPTWVYTTFTDKKIHKSPVKWNTKTLNVKKTGTYTLVGTVNGTSLKASVKVVVKAAPVVKPTPAPVVKAPVATEVYAVSDVTVETGKQPSLPTYVRVLYTDGSVHHVPVTWDTTSLDVTKAGTYTLTGTVRGTNIPVYQDVVVKAAADTEKPVITLNGDATVNVANGASYTDAGATVTDNKDTNLQATATITDAAGNAVTAIDTKVAGTYTVTYTAVDAAGNQADAVKRTVVVAPQAAPAVTSVSALNLKQVKVVFNQPVDATTAQTAANYVITDANGNSVTISGSTLASDTYQTPALQSDNKTVILTLNNAVANQSSYNVKVTGVKTADGSSVVPDATNTVSFLDTALPTVSTIQVTGPNSARVFFSEPVTNISTSDFTADGGMYGIQSAQVVSTQQNAVDVVFGSNLTNGNHTLTVNGSAVKDFAGFAVSKTDLPFTFTADTTAPTVSLVSANQTQVVLKFNKPMLHTDLISFYHTFNNNSTTAPSAAASWASDNQTVTLTFGGTNFTALPAGNVTIFVNNKAASTDTVQPTDNYGNVFASTTLNANVVADTTVPTVSKVTFIDKNHVDVQFSKAVTNVTTTPFSITDSTGNNVAVSSVATSPTGVANTYRLTTASDLNGATYTLKIAGNVITDTSVSLHPVAAYTTTFTAPDTKAPVLNSVAASTDGKTLYAYYSKSMNASDITNVANYRFDGDTQLPSGTTITATTNNTVAKITLPSAYTGSNLIVGSVHDAVGNVISGFTDSKAITPDSISSSDIVPTTVTAIGKDTVTFEVKQPLSNAVALPGATIHGEQIGSLSYVNKVLSDGVTSGAVVTAKLQAGQTQWGTDGAVNGLSSYTIALPANSLTNANGTSNSATISQTISSTKDAILPTLVSTTPIQTMDVDGNGKVDHVKLTFSEPVNAGTVSTNEFSVNGYKVTDAYASSSAPTSATARTGAIVANANTVYLTVTENSNTDVTAAPTVTVANGIQDAAGNAFTFSTTSTTPLSQPVAGITSAVTRVQGNAGTAPTPVTLGGLSFAVNTSSALNGYTFKLGTVADGTTASASVDTTNKVITINGDFDNTDAAGTYSTASAIQTAVASALSTASVNATVSVSGTATATAANTASSAITGGVDNATESVTLTLSGTATSAGQLVVTAGSQVFYVPVASGDTASVIAGNVRTAIGSNVSGYTAGGTGAAVTLTSGTANTNVTDLAVSAQ